jgi:hypothetical protein
VPCLTPALACLPDPFSEVRTKKVKKKEVRAWRLVAGAGVGHRGWHNETDTTPTRRTRRPRRRLCRSPRQSGQIQAATGAATRVATGAACPGEEPALAAVRHVPARRATRTRCRA